MPINEAVYRRSNLTKEQKREAEAAIYGLSTQDMNPQFNSDEIERMRQIIAQHDSQQPKGIKEFDLNNPPKVPYTYQEFPKLVYDHDSRRHMKVHNAEQEREAIDAGWRNEPYPAEVPEEYELSASDVEEVARLDKIARKKRKQAE